MKGFFLILSLASLALAASLGAEILFEYEPCLFCLMQRALYALLIPTSIHGTFFIQRSSRKGGNFIKFLTLFLLSFIVFIGSIQTLIQTNVIAYQCQHPSLSSLKTPLTKNKEAFKELLYKKKSKSCTEQVLFLGPAPGSVWSASLASIAAGGALIFWRKERKILHYTNRIKAPEIILRKIP